MNRVIRFTDTAKIEVFEEQIPKLETDQALVKVLECGICGSDLHYFRHGGLGTFKARFPMSIGHEVTGVVEDPNNSKNVVKGDMVAIEPILPCMNCEYCNVRRYNLCQKQRFLGSGEFIGGMQDYMPVYERQLVKLPAGTKPDYAVMLEPFSIALGATSLPFPDMLYPLYNLSHKICILGTGPIGILCGYACHIHGADIKNIFFSDINRDRLDHAQELINFARFKHFYGLKEHIERQSFSERINYVFDCAGTQESFDMALKILKPGGKLILIGIPEVDYLLYNPHRMRAKGLTIFNCRRSNVSLREAFNTSKEFHVPLDRFVTHHWKPEKAQDAFWTLSTYNDKCLKGVITFNESEVFKK